MFTFNWLPVREAAWRLLEPELRVPLVVVALLREYQDRADRRKDKVDNPEVARDKADNPEGESRPLVRDKSREDNPEVARDKLDSLEEVESHPRVVELRLAVGLQPEFS